MRQKWPTDANGSTFPKTSEAVNKKKMMTD